MIDHDKETLISFRQAAKRLPKTPSGREVHPDTIARWALHGKHGIRLETLKLGGRRVTSVEACQRFFEGCTIGREVTETVATRNKRHVETRRELSELGL